MILILLTTFIFSYHTWLQDTNSYFIFCLKFKRLYIDHLMTTFFQTFILWLLAYLTLFIPIENLNERFMGAVTALLVLASLLGSMENDLPKSSQMKLIDYWFLWYIINIFFIIIFHVILENCGVKERKFLNKLIIFILPFSITIFNFSYFSISVSRHI